MWRVANKAFKVFKVSAEQGLGKLSWCSDSSRSMQLLSASERELKRSLVKEIT